VGNVIYAAERFRENYDRSPDEAEVWACIDERLALIRGLRRMHTKRNGDNVTVVDFRAIRNQHYHSTAGGAAGFGNDIHIAARMGRAPHLGKIELSVMASAHVQGSVGVKVARESRIHILNHIGCAAEDGTLAIGGGIVTGKGPNGEDIYEAIKNDWSKDGRRATLPYSRFRQIQETWAEALAADTIASPDVSKPVHDNGAITESGAELLPIARASLVDMPHYATKHLIEWGEDMIYNREAALDASDHEGDGDVYGAYQTSMGSAMSLYNAVKSVFPVHPEDFLDGMYVRNAATSLWLPRQESEQVPVQLMAIGQ
jgi:hypothetical protein